jgi:hypothetical protein
MISPSVICDLCNSDLGPFLREERELLDNIAHRIGEYLEWKQRDLAANGWGPLQNTGDGSSVWQSALRQPSIRLDSCKSKSRLRCPHRALYILWDIPPQPSHALWCNVRTVLDSERVEVPDKETREGTLGHKLR